MQDQDALEFEGEKIGNSKLSVKGGVAMVGRRILHRKDRFGVVGKALVADIKFSGDGAATREHGAAFEEARLVDLDLVDDVIELLREAETGQQRLLSPQGERWRASRQILHDRLAVLDGDEATILAADGETLDALDPIDGLVAFLIPVEEQVFVALRGLLATVDDFDAASEWYDHAETLLTRAGAFMLTGIEWARRRGGEAREAERKAREDAEEEARQRAIAAGVVSDDPDDTPNRQVLTDGDGRVLVDEQRVVEEAVEDKAAASRAQVSQIRQLAGEAEDAKPFLDWLWQRGYPDVLTDLTSLQAEHVIAHLTGEDETPWLEVAAP